MRRRATYIGAVAFVSLLFTGAVAGDAEAARSEDPPVITLTFTTGPISVEYGQSWYLEARGENAGDVFGDFSASGTLTGAPSGYAPAIGAYRPDPATTNAFMVPSDTSHSLPAGVYSATLTITESDGGGASSTTATPAQLTITPAALAIALQIAADPSNPANAIVSARFTGAFTDGFFSTSFAGGPLSPAGSWTIRIVDAEGVVAHELQVDRTSDDDVLAVSSYWSDVPPGEYTARATFTPSGESAANFSISDATPVTYAAAAEPGSGSTAPPAPPAPPAREQSGLTLPLWIPIAAGVLSAGLLALLIVQIVRLRRTGIPVTPTMPAATA